MLINDILTEDNSIPLWASIIQKGLEKGVKFYFSVGGYRIVKIRFRRDKDNTPYIILNLEHTSLKEYGEPKREVYTVWDKVYDTLTLKKWADGYRLIFHSTVEEDVLSANSKMEVLQETEEPLVVRIINNRISKGGAVLVDVPVMPAGNRVRGWIAKPLEVEYSMSGDKMFRVVTAGHFSGAKGKVFRLVGDADTHYTLKTETDRNGNKYLKLVNRDDSI